MSVTALVDPAMAKWVLVGALGVMAAACDLRSRRVPNVITFGGAAAAIVISGVLAGFNGLPHSMLGWLIGCALFFPLFAVGGMGAGDVKLLAAFGAVLGPMGAAWAAIWASVAGGVLALAVAVAHGYLLEALRNVRVIVYVWRTLGFSPVDGLTLGDARGPRMAYAVPISIGALVTLWLRQG